MADIHRLLRPLGQITLPCDNEQAFNVGDMLWWDSTNGYLDQLSDYTYSAEETNRRDLKSVFAGVALEARTGKETNDSTMVIATSGVFEMPMTSGTPVIGTLLGFEKASGSTMEDQKLQIVTDMADAIGYCVKRYTAATTTVECALFSAFDPLWRTLSSKFLSFGACNLVAAADIVTNWLFKARVKLLSITSIERTAATANSVITVKNGSNSLDDTHTVTATAVGTFLRTAFADANDYDIFEHDGAMDIACDGTASAGTADLIIEYMELPIL